MNKEFSPWIVAGAALLLAGCWPSGPVQLGPIKRPPDFIPHLVFDPNSGKVLESGTAIAGGRLTIRALKPGTNERIKDALITLIGPTPAFGPTSDTLDLTLQPLEPGAYSVRVEAPGYVPQLKGGITIAPRGAVEVEVPLVSSGGDVTGRVTDSAGTPLSGARISLQEAYAFTGADGSFRLKGAPTGPQTAAVSKTGYAMTTSQVSIGAGESALGNVTLATKTPVVAFENASQSFAGSTVWDSLSAVRTRLTNEGFTIQTEPTNADVRVIASPTGAGLGDVGQLTESLKSFVSEGGKLVLIGEWGGFGDYSPGVLNRLASPYGLGFNADLVRTGQDPARPDWIAIPSVSETLPRAVAIPSGLMIFQSCSLFAPPPAVKIASTGEGGFRVASLLTGDLVVAAARPYGKGLVVLLGDTSAWVAPGTRSGNASNLLEASNGNFIADVFRW